MVLTAAQETIWAKARSIGTSEQAIQLSDAMCAYLVLRIAADLGCSNKFPGRTRQIQQFFGREPCESLAISGLPARPLFERLVGLDANADTYFACLASLLKARLKYERILATQPLPTFEQVGPRGLLQYGKINSKALAGFLLWRKWMFDIDNRAGQDTGYLFEPIIAYALGGTPAPAKKSPVRRQSDKKKGRQVDCILERQRGKRAEKRAYEIKLRVTIAASGQGRWKEETEFPTDCRASGYKPILVCLDATPNPKLKELVAKFKAAGGEAYVGEDAWGHLDAVAGPTLARFIDLYVKEPMKRLLRDGDATPPDLTAKWRSDRVEISVGRETLTVRRGGEPPGSDNGDGMPGDVLDGSEQ